MPPAAPRVLAVLPARFASTRFPGKPLADDTGKPLIRHVVERVAEARSVHRVVVATDDERIREAVGAFGAEAVMTGEHDNGTSRIAEAVDALEAGGGEPFDVVLNVQGDEPEVPAATIDALVMGLIARPDADMATLASVFEPGEDPANTNIVKLVADRRGFAMYFSRSLVPFDRDAERLGRRPGMTDPARGGGSHPGWTLPGPGPFKHPGLYAYRRAFLRTYASLPPAPLEETEKLEQLRVLEHGHRIAVVLAAAPHPGIDTPEQYDDFVKRWTAANPA
ncbi:3-deoxy-manno-octulosonate cytidylyltransferase [Phycisphaera mikurensis]|uniref:3-deoxy-manno-octulosonate cytidylyltransferase n=1 Tax=Phycisphaera mikurensis (strain NBRC 102666 / KCTC 22515 / FYK2301M01) TaxID=1142394 RepID=I0IBF9_PHYMF|nr:3-deoxy-manno-octulosonate cytidylyltransferase [Phycisphaera mikurensis]MBB6442870.1 3-deoxy-manno-octulosonate cytidylyltransferase (CMP-KDO synthetase) [Phycisphaera mikurensis]BAM02597.1 3-deoxy-manno-octulosonate cytidylyltransferase [Phycisphaera mikurensis NBRC 102666]